MKRFFVLLLMMLLVACGSAAPADLVEPADAPANGAPANGAPAAAVEPAQNVDAAGTVVEAAVLRDTDWTKGAAEPSVVIIEYGDFQ